MKENYLKAANIIKNSKNLITLTGAGISVESGIPDFRGKNGLWTRYDPMEYVHIETFRINPERSWELLFAMRELTGKAQPNPAHFALSRLEEIGLLKAVITQNIDRLHQKAGNNKVIEFHGNDKQLECLDCGRIYESEDYTSNKIIPRCKICCTALKPTVIFFGENIPPKALMESMQLADAADTVIVIGTTAEVYPAASIPYRAKEKNGAAIIEMNLEMTNLSGSITDIFIEGMAGTTLPELLKFVEE